MDVATLTKALTDPRLPARWRYYTGDHPQVYLTAKIRTVFRALADSLPQNYCGLAVNARLQRLRVLGFTGPDADAASQVWDLSRLPQRQDVAWRWGLVHGAVTMALDLDRDGQTILAPVPATLMHVEPDPADPFQAAWAGKQWRDQGRWHMRLWDRDTVQDFHGPEGEDTRPAPDHWTPVDEPTPHGWGGVPAVSLEPYGYRVPSLIDTLQPTQDRINKLVANKFVAAEFGAFRQRVFFTTQEVDDGALEQAPDRAIILDPGIDTPARVQEMTPTDLTNYDKAIDAEVNALFTIAPLPRHLRVNPGASPSGEAIKADEGPFVETVEDNQREFGEGLATALRLLGLDADPVWKSPVVNDDQANATVVRTLAEAGVPWQPLMERYLGWTAEEVADLSDQAFAASVTAALGV
jgi:hypothetical protein